jgi:predicted small secreted protein
LLLVLLLAVGVAACDDTVEGIEDDAGTIGEEVEEGVDDVTDE